MICGSMVTIYTQTYLHDPADVPHPDLLVCLTAADHDAHRDVVSHIASVVIRVGEIIMSLVLLLGNYWRRRGGGREGGRERGEGRRRNGKGLQ